MRAASSDPELASAVLAGRDQASRIVMLREGDGDRLAMAARLGEQKHYLIVDPTLETLATLEQLRKPLLNHSISVLARPSRAAAR